MPEGSRDGRKCRRFLILAVKLAVAGGLVYWIFRQVKWSDVLAALSAFRPGFGVAAAVVSLVSVALSALRWRVLLLTVGIRSGVIDVICLGYMGDFFSMAVPGNVGGDLLKAYYVSKRDGRYGTALLSVFMDRVIGLYALAILAGVMLLFLVFSGGGSADVSVPAGVTVGIVLTGITLFAVLVRGGTLRRVATTGRVGRLLGRFRTVEELGTAMLELSRCPAAVVRAMGLSAITQTLQICSVLLIGLGLGLRVPLLHYFLCVPLILILSSVPITPGSIGVTEELFLLYFAGQAAPGGLLALALLNRVLLLLSVVVGAVFAVVRPVGQVGQEDGAS